MTVSIDRMERLEDRVKDLETKVLSLQLWRAFQMGAAVFVGLGAGVGGKAIAIMLAGSS